MVESHYCRAQTSKLYLESSLNISKMYDLYLDHCKKIVVEPVKKHMFTSIFKELDISFQKPKKDSCAKCELIATKRTEPRNTISVEREKEFEKHLRLKEQSRAERNCDRQSEKCVVSFDMQNVTPLPKAEISRFFFTNVNCHAITSQAIVH